MSSVRASFHYIPLKCYKDVSDFPIGTFDTTMTPTHKNSQTIKHLYNGKSVYSHAVYLWIPLGELSLKIHVSPHRSLRLPWYDVISNTPIHTKPFSHGYGHVVSQMKGLVELSVFPCWNNGSTHSNQML